MLDVFLIIVLALILGMAVWIMVMNKKQGKGCHSCGGSCSSCHGGCSGQMTASVKKKQEKK